MSSDPRMPLGGAKLTFPVFFMSPLSSICLLCCDVPANVVISCSCGRYRPISRVIRRPAEPCIVPSTNRVIRHTPEPPMPAPVPCVNSFALLSQESLYDSPLDLGLSVEALALASVLRARRHCISSAGIGTVDNASVISSGPGAKAKLDQITFPVIDNTDNVPELVSRALAHIGQTFVKQALSSKSTLPTPKPAPATKEGKVIADIVRGLGIPCKHTDFHCRV